MTPREQHLQSRIDSLKAALDLAQQRIDELEKAFGTDDDLLPLRMLGLTPKESRIVHLLLSRNVVMKDALLLAMYSDEPDRRFDVQEKIVDTVVCRIRAKLKKLGVTFGRPAGSRIIPGITMMEADKARLRRLLASRASLVTGRSSDQRTKINRIIAARRTKREESRAMSG